MVGCEVGFFCLYPPLVTPLSSLLCLGPSADPNNYGSNQHYKWRWTLWWTWQNFNICIFVVYELWIYPQFKWWFDMTTPPHRSKRKKTLGKCGHKDNTQNPNNIHTHTNIQIGMRTSDGNFQEGKNCQALSLCVNVLANMQKRRKKRTK